MGVAEGGEGGRGGGRGEQGRRGGKVKGEIRGIPVYIVVGEVDVRGMKREDDVEEEQG